jgi:hypothetical protein
MKANNHLSKVENLHRRAIEGCGRAINGFGKAINLRGAAINHSLN